MSQIAIWRTLPVEPFGYWHHGVLCPDKSVIHFKSRASLTAKRHARIVHASLSSFRGSTTPKNTPIYRVKHRKQLPPDEVVRRARSCIGQRGYNLLHNNCESFARWCVVGDHRSYQIEKLTSAFKAGYRNGNVPGAMYAMAKTAVDMPVPCPSMVPLSARSRKAANKIKKANNMATSTAKQPQTSAAKRDFTQTRSTKMSSFHASTVHQPADVTKSKKPKSSAAAKSLRSRPISPSRTSVREKSVRSRATSRSPVQTCDKCQCRSKRK